ncbi:MAG: pyridoxamine kinase [Spirochaetes bacterium]|nr:pyridoxamine kinase [Spirochaetota bacterium]
MKKPVYEIAAVHDLSGYGKCSLTVAIPILAVMGMQACPLATSILSTQTSGFNNYTFFDFTDQMEKIINHWESLNLKFDAIYTGFLGSARQIDIILNFIERFNHEKMLIVIDPVLGDDGKLYDTIDKTIVGEMKKLVTKANLITPNITEAAILLGEDNYGKLSDNKIKSILGSLADMGPEMVAITSVIAENEKFPIVVAYDKKLNKYWKIRNDYVPASYSGTGDIFASIVTGCTLRGDTLPISVATAISFITEAIKDTYACNIPPRNGIMFERVLGMLLEPSVCCAQNSLQVVRGEFAGLAEI